MGEGEVAWGGGAPMGGGAGGGPLMGGGARSANTWRGPHHGRMYPLG